MQDHKVGVPSISAGTTQSGGQIIFSNSNGMSFGMNGRTVTGSYTVPTVTNSAWTASDNATSLTIARMAFTNLNGVTLSLSTTTGGSATVVGSHNALTSQSNQAVSANNGSYAFQTLSFSNANGMSFGTSAGSAITGSYTVPTVTNSSWTVSDAATSGSVARLAFTNLNGVTLSLSSGAAGLHTIVGSHNALTSQSNQAFSAAGGSSAFQTLGFSDNSNVSFTNTNGSVGVANVRASLYAVSNTTQSSSGTQNLSALSFGGAGIASVGVTNGSVVISVPSGGGAGYSAGVSTGGNTAGATGVTGTRLVFVGTNNITLSQTTDANGGTISISGAGAGATLSSYWEGYEGLSLLSAPGNGSVSLERWQLGQNVSATMMAFPVYQSISSSAAANTYGQVWSIRVMILTNDTAGNRLMSLSSGSTQTTYTVASNTAGDTGINGSGVRPITCPININATPGQYYIAVNWSTNTSSVGTATTALNRTVSLVGRRVIMSASYAEVSAYDQATANTVNRLWPQGVLSNGATAGIPTTISHSQVTMTGASHSQANLAFYMRA